VEQPSTRSTLRAPRPNQSLRRINKAFDHIDRRGRRSSAYAFTTPFKLLEDFLAEVERIIEEERAS
jgi:hypothetical protein